MSKPADPVTVRCGWDPWATERRNAERQRLYGVARDEIEAELEAEAWREHHSEAALDGCD